MESARKILQFIRPGTTIEFPHDNEKEINRNKLINRLNYLNFQDGSLLVNFKHTKYTRTISLEAKPLPCEDEMLECHWVDPSEILLKIKSATFENLFVIDGYKLVVVEPALLEITERGVCFRLPEACREVCYRKVRRHLCDGVNAQIMQNSALFDGTLLDFNAVTFRVEVAAEPPQTFQWLDPDLPVNVVFSSPGGAHYSGECRIIKQNSGQKLRTYVLEPLRLHKPRFKPKTYRSTRQELVPSPQISFIHPFTGKQVSLRVHDLSGGGFSVEEDASNSVLLPGMIIKNAELRFANSFSSSCQVQVVYRHPGTSDPNAVRCGLTILDMDIQEHVKLLSLIYQVNERNSYLCNKVDMDQLWQFFFETGFIYPKKYGHIKANKERYRDLYEKLYTQNPSIARHFIYQERGIILGHMATIRFFENSWLIHHHAASKVESNRAGIVVLNQIGRFINDSHRLYSIHMNHVFCYYRPDNKFPHKIFGGVARHLKNSKACSLDEMAYLHVRREFNSLQRMSDAWGLTPTVKADLQDLEDFYEGHSGGLMIDALDLEPSMLEGGDISREYAEIGFKRERHLFSLKHNGSLVAVFMISLSDIGLNMSELTNCVNVFVLDPEELTRDTLSLALSILFIRFDQEDMPVLIYPHTYAQNQQISYERTYNLWVLSMLHTDKYFGYLDRLLKTVKS
jgi:hypothetical protein